MNGKPQSVSIEKLNAAIAEAAKTHSFARGDLKAGFLPDPGVFGYILRDPDFNLPVKDLQVLAADITTRVGIVAKPTSVLFDGHIIVGFLPANDFISFER